MITPEQIQVDQFNSKHKLGDEITYTNEKGEQVKAAIRHEAELIDNRIPVVYVKGNYNAVQLINVNP
jgi:hypothetical protein